MHRNSSTDIVLPFFPHLPCSFYIAEHCKRILAASVIGTLALQQCGSQPSEDHPANISVRLTDGSSTVSPTSFVHASASLTTDIGPSNPPDPRAYILARPAGEESPLCRSRSICAASRSFSLFCLGLSRSLVELRSLMRICSEMILCCVER